MAARKLDRYRARRDFTRTAEPSGAKPVAPSERLRFVIQKHAARRLHYDLRLELDGVFKSWAVTRGPSLDPADKRLAVEVEDHPLDYGDFEGTIPRGEYGGGTVLLWDRGYWTSEGETSAAEQLRRGTLKFSLDGEKLHGSWVLVRMRRNRDGNGRTNWLLIKHRDEHARSGNGESLLQAERSVASGRDLEQITAGKGSRPKPFMVRSKSRGAANAVWHSKPSAAARRERGAPARARRRGASSKPPPQFIPPQLAKLVSRAPNGGGWGHEIKIDGYRLQLRVADAAVSLRTRKGLDWTEKFPTLAATAAEFPDCIVDGEVAAFDSSRAPSFHALQEALSRGDDSQLVYFAFDLLFESGEDLRARPLSERKNRLERLLQSGNRSSPIQYVGHFETSGDAVLRSACQAQLEGIVSKRLDAPYRSGRNETWTKAKCRGGQEVVIGGWSQEGTRIRSLLVGVYRKGQLVYAGRTGTGFGAVMQKILRPKLRALETRTSPFEGPHAPRAEAGVHWARPELVAEIEFAGWTSSGIVRQAAFKGLREDKPARDVTVETPAAPPSSRVERPRRRTKRRSSEARARGAARASGNHAPPAQSGAVRTRSASSPKASDGGGAMVMGVSISKPEKVLWPDDGAGQPVTKRDLACYFEAVGPWMIGHLAGRPCSFVRGPDGIEGQQFFQRHAMKGTSHLLDLVRVAGVREPYLQIDRVEALAALAQSAALELHPWNCAPGHPEVPGRLVFDLDPAPEVDFAQVIATAQELRERLERVGLVPFCKTTGGKGLHVVAPLDFSPRQALDWPTAKTFAHTLCAQMADDSPDRYLVSMAKKHRTGRIFLDYLRNDRTATAIAPLSPRARPGAPVSMPLTWQQVRSGLDPKRYTLRTVPALLGRMTAWQDYDESARPLREAIRKLTKGDGRAAALPGATTGHRARSRSGRGAVAAR